MSQPPPYVRQANFTDHSAADPSTPHPGTSLDAEFDALLATIAATLANLALIQRDDGRLRNGSVSLETLSASLLLLLGASSRWELRGPWLTATSYAQTDVVVNGTGTFTCATAHTSGTFATDLAAGKWTLIFDSAGSTPADGSVTTPKLADASVTIAKLAITLLDLTSYIRAQGGLSAGTAATGELLAGKKDSGEVLGKIERATKAQGNVGWQIKGGSGSVNWTLRMPAASDALEIYDGTAVRVTFTGPLVDVSGAVRATGDGTPAAGPGIALRLASSAGWLDCFDHTATAWLDGYLRSARWRMIASGISVLDAQSTGVNFPVNAQLAGLDIGFRDVPQNVQSAAYSLVLSDRGKHIYSENVAGQTLTIPANATVAFNVGAAVVIVNRGSNPISVTPAGGVTLRHAGTTSTGTRTLATNGMATLLKVGADLWFISGAGIS